MLDLKNITVHYGDHTVVDHVSFSLKEGQWLMLVGPNGAGKSTLIHALSQGTPYDGSILLQNKNIKSYKPAQLARKIGILSQHNHVGYAYTVEEVVGLGRYAHSKSFLKNKEDNQDMVEMALQKTGMDALRKSSVLSLSGGELQRTFLAQVFAQDPEILVLDEPSNHLDLIYQKHIFSLIQEWLQQKGRAVISVVHDLSLAKRYGTHAVLMNKGKNVSQGSLQDVLTRENLMQVYGMDVYEWMQDMLSQWKTEKRSC